jgi:hypothetical protein
MIDTTRTGLGIKRCLLSATIIFNGSASVFNCTVRELTDDGARIAMDSTLGVPEQFKLVIKPREDIHFCEVTSRSEKDLYVKFTKTVVSMPRAHKRLKLVSW